MSKTQSSNPEYSREREFKVILEDIQSQFRTFGEGMDDVRKQLGPLEQMRIDLAQVKLDLSTIKSAFPRLVGQVADHEKRLTVLERAR